jgi:hypothetical protein
MKYANHMEDESTELVYDDPDEKVKQTFSNNEE